MRCGARCGPGGGRAWGSGGASGMHGEGQTKGLGARARAGRTWNILCMSVTLDVSKLSGWLNFDADCQPKGGHAMRGEVQGREAGGVGRWRRKRRARGRPDLRLGGQGTRGAHHEHVVHVRDLGGVKAQRLVERRRALCRVKRVACDMERGARPGGGGEGAVAAQAACTGKRPDPRLGGQLGHAQSARRTCRPCL